MTEQPSSLGHPPGLRIATRASPLALWQAERVRAELIRHYSELSVELVTFTTQGDRELDRRLMDIGGKGLFIKELERALQDNAVDLAVHSMKDVPAQLPAGLTIAAVLTSADPRDALVSRRYARLEDLPQGARVGTSSLRRQCQLLHLRPDLQIGLLRGNVQTRLSRLDEGRFDAIILAAAGLDRLGLADRITDRLAAEIMLPAAGQGVVGVECQQNNTVVLQKIAPLNDPLAAQRIRAERALTTRLGGNCHVPVAGFAEVTGHQIRLRGLVGQPDGSQLIQGEISGSTQDAEALGRALATELLDRGARQILQAMGAHPMEPGE